MLYIPFNRVSAMVKKRVQGQTSSSPRYPGLWECRSRPILSIRAKSIAGMMILKKMEIQIIGNYLLTQLNHFQNYWFNEVQFESLAQKTHLNFIRSTGNIKTLFT